MSIGVTAKCALAFDNAYGLRMKTLRSLMFTYCSMISSGRFSKGGIGEIGVFSILDRRTSVVDTSMTLCRSTVGCQPAYQVDESRRYLKERKDGQEVES
jgi:hypothetical protein